MLALTINYRSSRCGSTHCFSRVRLRCCCTEPSTQVHDFFHLDEEMLGDVAALISPCVIPTCLVRSLILKRKMGMTARHRGVPQCDGVINRIFRGQIYSLSSDRTSWGTSKSDFPPSQRRNIGVKSSAQHSLALDRSVMARMWCYSLLTSAAALAIISPFSCTMLTFTVRCPPLCT